MPPPAAAANGDRRAHPEHIGHDDPRGAVATMSALRRPPTRASRPAASDSGNPPRHFVGKNRARPPQHPSDVIVPAALPFGVRASTAARHCRPPRRTQSASHSPHHKASLPKTPLRRRCHRLYFIHRKHRGHDRNSIAQSHWGPRFSPTRFYAACSALRPRKRDTPLHAEHTA